MVHFSAFVDLATETSALLPRWRLKLSVYFHLGEYYWKDFSSPDYSRRPAAKNRTGHSGFVQALNTFWCTAKFRELSLPPDLQERSGYAFSRWINHIQSQGRNCKFAEEKLPLCQMELRETATATISKQGAMHLKEMQSVQKECTIPMLKVWRKDQESIYGEAFYRCWDAFQRVRYANRSF